MEATYTPLLCTRLMYDGYVVPLVIQRIHEVKVETAIFTEKNQNEDANMRSEYNILSNKTSKALLPFAKSYLYETGFSALAETKLKYCTRLVAEGELRVAISSLTPTFDRLCNNYRKAHPSH
ncbi:hypothetical protein QYM36_016264 [Artemia franciscana]|uniref:Uncharacterized protein n=1 Tax=Artemia franciscana TaxID=6661 RepID=A0AA88KTJ5_ARTSF|nr:hypothetical protein QYM36_016264 [Artemia franciscana]